MNKNTTATILGFVTTLVTAVEFIDFDTLNWSSINTYVKLGIVLLPAIGGYVSEVKNYSSAKPQNPEAESHVN